ncbi:MAG: DNA-binding response regulator [Gammaproteobacteria bacterium]|nr:MAG: DNA-binding response regulator [Gammaproteobacteria bacterium]PIE37409.1 MAG: DNA-binding response regulator [Gammaproteobacteria bacterium]
MRVLVAEDDAPLRAQLAEALQSEGYVIDAAADGEEALWIATSMPIDIAVIDIGLPVEDGLAVIRRLRDQGHAYPVLILTARDTWEDKVEGLEAGADDYLCKPFHVEELLARLRALLRRAGGWTRSMLDFGRLTIDTRAQSVAIDGEPVALTAYEYRLLAYLANQGGAVISKADLLDHLYDEDTERDPNVLEVFVRRLRNKLDPDGSLQPIETLRGRGYRIALPRQDQRQDRRQDQPLDQAAR